MNTQLPRLEARVSAVERLQTILQARIEEVAEEMATSVMELKTIRCRLNADKIHSSKNYHET